MCPRLLLSEVLVFSFMPEGRALLRDIALPIVVSMSSILSSRFILHLREHVSESYEVESRPLSMVRFEKADTSRDSPKVANSYASQYC